MIYRIAITGPESTGKSRLSAQLAEHFNTVWAPEYAREYLQKIQRPYTQEDLLEIAKGQKRMHEKMMKFARNILFCDTEMLVIKIWSEFKYGNCHPD
ncbi:MAG: ATP-binding protein, partial [Bacteroidales bacterium]|nr:ATP-binding protein [Bacteroidales bacterium]